MIDPADIPDGLDKAGLEAMTVDDGEWRVCEDFACAACGSPAYLHPYTNWIWGCKRCGFSTYSVSCYFVELPVRQAA